ncbi:discoidin domain-containing protein [Candidatus Woesearchaeota archaeon]|nr:discoidin domain-containing protein [Candidatus Woesearchaeota archaeon]
MAKKRKNKQNSNQLITVLIILIAIIILGGIYAGYINSQKNKDFSVESENLQTQEEPALEENVKEIFEKKELTKVKKIIKPKVSVPTTDRCGNEKADLGETCSSCPNDIKCNEGYSCIESECKEVTLTFSKGVYCGHLRGSYQGNNGIDLTDRAVNYASSCSIEGSGPEKAFDGKRELSQYVWMCINKDGLSLPQFVAVELEKEYIINQLRIFQKGGNDLFNIREISLEVSIDSTDGQNGHWIPVEIGNRNILINSQKESLDTFFDPVSAKWVRVLVLNTWKEPITHLAIGEIFIYESKYICESDYNSIVRSAPY